MKPSRLPCALSRRLNDVNGEIFISSSCALRFLGACSAAFGAADIGMGTIANVQADIVQLLSCSRRSSFWYWQSRPRHKCFCPSVTASRPSEWPFLESRLRFFANDPPAVPIVPRKADIFNHLPTQPVKMTHGRTTLKFDPDHG